MKYSFRNGEEEIVYWIRYSSSSTLNRYSYVLNNPLGLIDPSGFACEAIFDENGDESQELDPTSSDYDSASCLSGGDPTTGDDANALYTIKVDVAEEAQTKATKAPPSNPSDACDWLGRALCEFFFDRKRLWDNLNQDKQIFNITNDPYLWATSRNGVQLGQINRLEQINLIIDNVALGKQAIADLDHIPDKDLLPPGVDKAQDAGIEYFQEVRDSNNARIDQLLQSTH